MASRKSGRRSRAAAPFPFASLQLILDCQAVIALRLMKLAGGGRASMREATRMVGEKVEAAVSAQLAAGAALVGGEPRRAVARATSVYARKIRANRRRLTPR